VYEAGNESMTGFDLFPTVVKRDSNQTVWHGSAGIVCLSFGTFGATINLKLSPTPRFVQLATALGRTDILAQGEKFPSVHNSTSILIESSRAITAEETAQEATQVEISLTYFIIFLATADIGFTVFDYSLDKHQEPTRTTYDEEP
jgi:hypothetical protein